MWTIGPSDGELTLRTAVAGRAARMGHRLTIAMRRWRATVTWRGDEPVAAELAVEVESFDVLRGDGGVKGLSGPEKVLVRANAMKSIEASRFPDIRFVAGAVEPTADGYRLVGELTIHGRSHQHVIELRTEDLGDSWRMSANTTVRQTDYGIKPYSLLMGSVQVADDVSIAFTAVHAKVD
ncbi:MULTISPECIES: YceI family protein [unclassified Mycobacterium]|uniref:YceI family protein n=1 Tax=unclassified Mycobacterium TaxID=2642494 RepID=UPI000801A099|nr:MULTISPECIES: YceI family protein [unclassified Mycobacterium]OBG76996.1 S-adenosyl-L-methionine-dependent methyltransferase [Mycobacterium sp. E1214]OBH23326.1 S-adenosyl-L-methionine-dependent methyltransferase [Mycobacterium sp. E1319]